MEDKGDMERRRLPAASPSSPRTHTQVEFTKLKMLAFDLQTGAALIDVTFTSCCSFQSAQCVGLRPVCLLPRSQLFSVNCADFVLFFIIITIIITYCFSPFRTENGKLPGESVILPQHKKKPRCVKQRITAQFCRVVAFSESIAPSDPDPITEHWSSQE